MYHYIAVKLRGALHTKVYIYTLKYISITIIYLVRYRTSRDRQEDRGSAESESPLRPESITAILGYQRILSEQRLIDYTREKDTKRYLLYRFGV